MISKRWYKGEIKKWHKSISKHKTVKDAMTVISSKMKGERIYIIEDRHIMLGVLSSFYEIPMMMYTMEIIPKLIDDVDYDERIGDYYKRAYMVLTQDMSHDEKMARAWELYIAARYIGDFCLSEIYNAKIKNSILRK